MVVPYPWETTGFVPMNMTTPPDVGSHTGLSIAWPAINSAATRTGALSTVAAEANEDDPIARMKPAAATCAAASYANPVARYMAIESDRMRSLAITDANLTNQKEAVKEERRLSFDNRPYNTAKKSCSFKNLQLSGEIGRIVPGI